MKFNYHEDGVIPAAAPQTVWVFGSNLAGIHGAGAALIAHRKFYANWNKGQGWVGLFAYAIPTKGYDVQTTLPLSAIESHAMVFERMTYKNPTLKFFVTRIGCGLAGYKDEDIAPMFKDCNPDNVSFPEQWAQYLEPKLKPVIEKKGAAHPDFLAHIRGQHRGLYADLEDQVRSCIRTNRERAHYILNEELPRVKQAIANTIKTLEFLRELTGLRDEDLQRHVSAIQTLNKVRREQREELTRLAEHQRYNKNALNTLMRERERCLPSCGVGVPDPSPVPLSPDQTTIAFRRSHTRDVELVVYDPRALIIS